MVLAHRLFPLLAGAVLCAAASFNPLGAQQPTGTITGQVVDSATRQPLAGVNVVVEDGILKTFLLDSYSARKLDRQSTASASRGGASVSASTTNFVLAAGKITHDALVGKTERGLYVTDMMGFGFNALTGDFSRGASGYWIENGELAYPVSEVTISSNLDAMLNGIDEIANDLDFKTSTASPTFRVASMTIAGT